MKLFDLHCDTASGIFKDKINLKENNLHIDLKRGKAFDAYCQIFAFFVPDGLDRERSKGLFLNMHEYFEHQLILNKKDVSLCKDAKDIKKTVSEGKSVALYSIENGSALGGDIKTLDFCAKIGVKCIGITWNGENDLGYGRRCEGKLKPFGVEAVKRMEELGIIPDVSHLNDEGTWQVIELVNGPVVATHSNSRAVLDNKRNITDEQFKAIAARGGIVGINLYPPFLSGHIFAGFDDILRHIYHFLELGGENTLAFGADFDGADMDKKWNGVHFMPDIYYYLNKHGVTEDILDKIFFQNAFNFFVNLS